MECVKVRFAPTAEPIAARARLRQAIQRVNRAGRWRTVHMDFFAFAEIPAEESEWPELPEASEFHAEIEYPEESERETEGPEQSDNGAEIGSPEESDGGAEIERPEESDGGAESEALAPVESPFFCVLLCPDLNHAFLRELSDAAPELGMSFSPIAQPDAETWYREALETCRVMADAAAPELASACAHLGILLAETGRPLEAETLYREALELYAGLARRRSGWEAERAETRYYLARTLAEVGRADEAERFFCEAMDAYRDLSRRNADYQAPLAMTCRDLALCLEGVGRPEAAEWFYRNALDLYRKLAERYPEGYAARVALTCGNLAGLLKDAGRVAEAVAFYRVALDTYSKLVRENPALWEPELAFLYENLASFERGRSPKAAKSLLQSAYLLYQKYPDFAAEAERIRLELFGDASESGNAPEASDVPPPA